MTDAEDRIKKRYEGSKVPPSYRYSDNREAWIEFGGGNEFIMYRKPDGQIIFTVRSRHVRRKPFSFVLTDAPADSIREIRKFFTYLIDEVLPVTEEIDQRDKSDFDNTGEPSQRMYRKVLEFIALERPKREHGSSVPSGSDSDRAALADDPDRHLDAAKRL